MKTLGEVVRVWRVESGLGFAELARMVNANLAARAKQRPVKYQDLQNLEKGEAKNPRYLPALAKAMGTTVEELDALRAPRPLPKRGTTTPQESVEPSTRRNAVEERGDVYRIEQALAPDERRLLEAYRELLPEEQVEFAQPILERAELGRRHAAAALRKHGVTGVASPAQTAHIVAAPAWDGKTERRQAEIPVQVERRYKLPQPTQSERQPRAGDYKLPAPVTTDRAEPQHKSKSKKGAR